MIMLSSDWIIDEYGYNDHYYISRLNIIYKTLSA